MSERDDWDERFMEPAVRYVLSLIYKDGEAARVDSDPGPIDTEPQIAGGWPLPPRRPS